MSTPDEEVNFDGLVGPTHNHAGLSRGNLASHRHGGQTSRPREAALQGLEKMLALIDLGVPQGVLPPHERPHLPTLRALGFRGSDGQIVAAASRTPGLLAQVSSSSPMWTANAATVAPSADTEDSLVHFTPANLKSAFHRSLEAEQTSRALTRIFSSPQHFVHHDPLPGSWRFDDEGAANHTRLVTSSKSLHVFVYGRSAVTPSKLPQKFPARQTREASQAVARLHRLNPARTLFLQQHPGAIDEGVFHHDVISVGHESVFLCHERAFFDMNALDAIREIAPDVQVACVSESEISVADTVQSYLFNSQIVHATSGPKPGRTLIAPTECDDHPQARTVIEQWISDGVLDAATYLDVRQSMKNGGGPACLRLRVALTKDERDAVLPNCLLDRSSIATLKQWVLKHYREELEPGDLADPQLLRESQAALDELTSLLDLGSDFYPFQRS